MDTSVARRKFWFSDGFTLVELIVVVTLIGILSGVLFGIVKPRIVEDRSRDGVRIANVEKIAGVIDSIYSLEDSYPMTESSLRSSSYLTNWPDGSPREGDSYSYAYDAGEGTYRVFVPGSGGDCLVYPSSLQRVVRCPDCDSSLDLCINLVGGPVVIVPTPEQPPEDPEPPQIVSCNVEESCSCADVGFTCTPGYESSCRSVASACSSSECATGYQCCSCAPIAVISPTCPEGHSVVESTGAEDPSQVTCEFRLYAIEDTFLDKFSSGRNYSSSSPLHVGSVDNLPYAPGGPFRTLIRVHSFGEIPDGAIIEKAVLALYINRHEGSSDTHIKVFPIETPWDLTTVTWSNDHPSFGAEIASFEVPLEWRQYVLKEVDLTPIFRDWFSGSRPNYGLYLMQNVEPPLSRKLIGASEDAEKDRAPYFVITYLLRN